MNDIVTLCRDGIDQLESGEATQDQFLMAQNFVQKLGEVYREFKEKLEAASIAYIKARGDVRDGDVRYYVAPNKSTKCTDLRGAIESILETAGGDFDTLVQCLSSNALKPGESKKVLGEKAEQFFKTEVTDDLKTGKPTEPRLQKFDTKFMKGKQ